MTDPGDLGRRALLRTEARIAIVINAVLSIGFFLLIFGWRAVGAWDFAVDFLPQTFGVTFLGTLVPSLITYGRIAKGSVVPAGPVPPRGRHIVGILACAVGAVVILGGSAAALTMALAPASIAPLPGLIVKAVYGSLVGVLMTPPILRSLLGMPFLGGGARPLAGAR